MCIQINRFIPFSIQIVEGGGHTAPLPTHYESENSPMHERVNQASYLTTSPNLSLWSVPRNRSIFCSVIVLVREREREPGVHQEKYCKIIWRFLQNIAFLTAFSRARFQGHIVHKSKVIDNKDRTKNNTDKQKNYSKKMKPVI